VVRHLVGGEVVWREGERGGRRRSERRASTMGKFSWQLAFTRARQPERQLCRAGWRKSARAAKNFGPAAFSRARWRSVQALPRGKPAVNLPRGSFGAAVAAKATPEVSSAAAKTPHLVRSRSPCRHRRRPRRTVAVGWPFYFVFPFFFVLVCYTTVASWLWSTDFCSREVCGRCH
jgi:hypothetical protein